MFSKFEQDIFTEESKVFVSAKMTRVKVIYLKLH